ncbi:MAG: type III pantothenate kinase [Bacteroidia bacterium]
MNLIIDIGNTRVKAALFDGTELKERFVFETTDKLLLSGIVDKSDVKNCILASVVDGIDPFAEQLKPKCSVLIFESRTPVPLKNLYQTASTLGSDRLAAAVGGNTVFPDSDVLVIDAGTCIKYNFVNSRNEYLGGGISPGLSMRLKAMHTFTSRLPLVDVDVDFDVLVGSNTADSMLSGALIGAVAEVDGMIGEYKKKSPGVKVLFTGGDVNFFEKRIKNSIFADQNLVLKGLNRILTYNLNNKK